MELSMPVSRPARELSNLSLKGFHPVGVSVVGKRNAWYKALWCKGPEFERRRDWAFCSWALLPDSPEVLVCEDTQLDARWTHCRLLLCPAFICPDTVN